MSEDCPHCVFEKTEANCRGCFEGSHYKPKPTTNYDRIIGKTPEELAEWIESIEPAACPWRDDHGDNCCFTHCHDCWLDWLKQEATEWKVGPIASIVSEKTIRRSGSSG